MDMTNQVDAFDLERPQLRPVIELRIDELVLGGFGKHVGNRIGAALERELSRLISAGDLVHLTGSPLQLDALNAGTFRVEHGAHPNRIGRQIAQRVYREIAGVQPARSTQNTGGARLSHA